MKKEIWKIIPDTNGKYEVSTFGNVRSIKTKKIRKPVMIGNVFKKRYPAVRIPINGKWSTQLTHRLVALAFIPKINGKDFVNHIDGNRINSNILNLEWCTTKENIHHAWQTGLCKDRGVFRKGNKIL